MNDGPRPDCGEIVVHKRPAVMDDGRTIIYYTFSIEGETPPPAAEAPPARRED